MANPLVTRRGEVMDRAYRALDAAWPERRDDDYVREMTAAARNMEEIAAKMRSSRVAPLEQGRTYRLLGDVYSNLQPALGSGTLDKAIKAYRAAESLVSGDAVECAKLNFNFGNALLLTKDPERLREAKARLTDARTYFAAHEPDTLPQVDTMLRSVEMLMSIVPLSNVIETNMRDLAEVQKDLAAGADVNESAAKARAIMKRGGGPAGFVGQLQGVLSEMPEEMSQMAGMKAVRSEVEALSQKVLGGNQDPQIAPMLELLRKRLASEEASGSVDTGRAQSLAGVLDVVERLTSGDETDLAKMLQTAAKLREFVPQQIELCHYVMHKLNRPPDGSRAAELVELNWPLRRYLLEEMSRAEKGEEESKEALDLSIRATNVDRRIYEAGSDDRRARVAEIEGLRPLAVAIRAFSARTHTMLAKPIWQIGMVPVDSNAVFYAGSKEGLALVATSCGRLALQVMARPAGQSHATARWKQLQKALTTIFDLRLADGPDKAAVAYELGIALTIGKPVVVLVDADQPMPFDIDVDPVTLTGGPEDERLIAAAVDQSVTWTHDRADSARATLEYVLSLHPRPHENMYVDQTLRLLADSQQDGDPLAISRQVAKLIDYIKDGQTVIVHPRWSAKYADESEPRLFHVMPFGPAWAARVTEVAREICGKHGVTYVRGDEADDPDVIRSIWDEIAQATHVLVDLTGFNANVALELGIADTLGKRVMRVGQTDTVAHLFASIAKLRVEKYDPAHLQQTFGRAVKSLLTD